MQRRSNLYPSLPGRIVLILLGILLTVSLAPPAEAQEIGWVRQFGSPRTSGVSDHGVAAAVSDGMSYVVGDTCGTYYDDSGSTYSECDIFIRKYDSSGNELWTRQFGTGQIDRPYGVAANGSGVYIVGTASGALQSVSTSGAGSAFLRKYDPNGNEEWTRRFAGKAQAVTNNAFSVYVAGTVSGDVFLKTYDFGGSELWTRQFGSATSDYANAVSISPSGLYVVGDTWGTLPGQISTGSTDVFVRRYDLDGTETWTRQFGTSTYDRANGVASDASGVYVGGTTMGTLPGQTRTGSYDLFVRKYDANGSEAWTRQFDDPDEMESVGGMAIDSTGAYLVGGRYLWKLAADGNPLFVRWIADAANGVATGDFTVFVAGTTNGGTEAQLGFGPADAVITKLDTSGTSLWSRSFGCRCGERESGTAVGTGDGVYIGGYTYGTLPGQTRSGADDAFVRKYSASGTELWTQQFGTPQADTVGGVAGDATGAYVVGSTSGSLPGQASSGGQDAYVRRYDSAGTVAWTRQFGTPSSDGLSAAATDGLAVYVAGTTGGALSGQTLSGARDAFVRKYSASGTELWTRQFGSPVATTATGLALAASGVYVVGRIDGSLPGQTSTGGSDAYVRKYDADGSEIWTRQFGTASGDGARGVAADSYGVYVVGDTSGTLPGSTRAGNTDVFVAMYSPNGSPRWTRQFGTPAFDYARSAVSSGYGVFVTGDLYGVALGDMDDAKQEGFLRHYDPDGNQVWVREFGTYHSDFGNDAAIDSSGLYVAGTTMGAFYSDQLGPVAHEDAFLAKFHIIPPANLPPTSNAGGPYTVQEGGSVALSGTGTDPENGALAFAWDLNNDGTFETAGQNVTLSAAGVDGPASKLVILQVCDSAGLCSTNSATVSVTNATPAIEAVTAPGDPVSVGTPATTSAAFKDPGVLDTHSAIWDWGDGSTSAGTVAQPSGSVTGSVTGSHIYASAGVYSVKLTVSDKDGGLAQSTFEYLVVYDPVGGFVTGGGWMASPAGAYLHDPSHTGKATFGFFSRYQKWEATGDTEFRLLTAKFEFRSDQIRWMVVNQAGTNAQFKGEGTVNGSKDPNGQTYRFMVWATDGTPDSFRIKIWWEDTTEHVVYDNGTEQAIGGGSISVHAKDKPAAPTATLTPTATGAATSAMKATPTMTVTPRMTATPTSSTTPTLTATLAPTGTVTPTATP